MTDHQFEEGDRSESIFLMRRTRTTTGSTGGTARSSPSWKTMPVPSRAILVMLCCIVSCWKKERKLMSSGEIFDHFRLSGVSGNYSSVSPPLSLCS
jgi:hypothetical protein